MSGGHQSRERAYTEQDVALVAAALGADYWPDSDRIEAATAILNALVTAGRLVPPSAERREEWAVLVEAPGGVEVTTPLDHPDPEAWSLEYQNQVDGVRHRQVVITFATGWVPVDEDRPVGEVKNGIEGEESRDDQTG